MKTSSLDTLLEKLCQGDADAAEEVFRQYEPYLRKVVRRLLPLRLRPKFDSMDIVQSAWSDLFQSFRNHGNRFASANQLRAFLVTATRNRFIDRYRQQEKVAQREVHLAEGSLDQFASSSDGTPSQMLQADDLWERMLSLCPSVHRPILWLRRQGASVEEIAAETGLHPGSIRRILRSLASSIAAERLSSSVVLKDET